MANSEDRQGNHVYLGEQANEAELVAGSGGQRRGNVPGDSGDRDRKGRIVGRSRPTEKQTRFATELANGRAIGEAGRMAGYAFGGVAAANALKSVSVRKLIDRRRRRIIDQTVSIAVGVVRDVVCGKLRIDPIRWQATKYILDASGLSTPDQDGISDDTPLHQMTLAQLEALAKRAQEAKSFANVPELPADAVQVIEDKGESGS